MQVNIRVKVSNYERLMEVLRSALVTDYVDGTGLLFENSFLQMRLCFKEKPPENCMNALFECGEISYIELNYSEKEEKEAELLTKTEVITESSLEIPETKKEEKEDYADSNSKNVLNLDSILKQSNSKEDFVSNVSDFFEILPKQRDVFIRLVFIYGTLKKPTWSNIFIAFKESGVKFTTYDKQQMINAVSSKTTKHFLKIIAQISNMMNDLELTSSKTSDNEAEKKKLLPCMPDIVESSTFEKEIMELKEKIAMVRAENLSLKEKVQKVVYYFNPYIAHLKGYPSKEDFAAFTYRVMSRENVSLDEEIVNCDGLFGDKVNALRMMWSTIINTLAKMHDPNVEKQSITVQFLEQLKTALL